MWITPAGGVEYPAVIPTHGVIRGGEGDPRRRAASYSGARSGRVHRPRTGHGRGPLEPPASPARRPDASCRARLRPARRCGEYQNGLRSRCLPRSNRVSLGGESTGRAIGRDFGGCRVEGNVPRVATRARFVGAHRHAKRAQRPNRLSPKGIWLSGRADSVCELRQGR